MASGSCVLGCLLLPEGQATAAAQCTVKELQNLTSLSLSKASGCLLLQAGYSVQAHDSVLHRPGVSAVMAPELYALYEEAMAMPASLSAPADDDREQGALEQDNLGGYDAYPVDEEMHGDGAAADGEVGQAAQEAGGAKGPAVAAGSARKSMRSPGIAQPLTAEGNEGGQAFAEQTDQHPSVGPLSAKTACSRVHLDVTS